MKIAIYARVSTGDQNTLPMQVQALKKYAKSRQWKVVTVVEEVGSGTSTRPKREQLLKTARKREIDAILVWRLDRWGRSVEDLMHTLTELGELKVGFISLTEALDFTTTQGRAMAGMLAVFAKFESDVLGERVKAGIAHARAQGKPHGRPNTTARHAKEVKGLFLSGLSKTKIAKRLNIGRASVSRLLARRDNDDRADQKVSDDVKKEITVKLWLKVENNNKFIRGKKKAREDIERFVLREYNVKKLDDDGCEYELTIPYETEAELDETIDYILREADNTADLRHCFTEADVCTLDGNRSW